MIREAGAGGPGGPLAPGRPEPDRSLLREGERVDDLQRAGLVVIQYPRSVRFSTDSVLLAWFAASGTEARPSAELVESALDIGTGTGAIPLLLSARTRASRLVGVEIEPRLADMATRSVMLNRLQGRVEVTCGDVRDHRLLDRLGRFDLVTCNPPYVARGSGTPSPQAVQAVSGQELELSLDETCAAAYRLLKPRGRLCMVHRPDRLVDLLSTMRRHTLEPKRLRMVHSYAAAPPVLVLAEGVRDTKPGLTIEPPVVIYDDAGRYTPVMQAIYGTTGGGRRREPGVGLLSVCGTPIGNLADVTLRCVRTLAEADIVAAEQIRVSRKLLAHLGISKRMVSYREDVAEAAGQRILSMLREGRHVALLTAAGMPGVSDPGARLVKAARDEGHRVEVVPGPSAPTAAWAASGLVGKGFVFVGFLPRRTRELDDLLLRLVGQGTYPLVAFEAPHRVVATVDRIAALYPRRWVAVCRELTKVHEEVLSGSASDVAARMRGMKPMGEFTLVVAGKGDEDGVPGERASHAAEAGVVDTGMARGDAAETVAADAGAVKDMVRWLVESGVQKKQAIKQVAREVGLPKKDVYDLARDVPPQPPGTPKAQGESGSRGGPGSVP